MRKRFSMPVAATAAAAGGGGGTPPPADTVDNIEHSVRFNRADSPYLTRTISGSSNTYTVSMWVKRHKVSATGEYQYLFSFNDTHGLAFNPGDTIYIYNGSGVTPSTAVFRDPSAWYHVCLSVNNLSADVFVNGLEVISNISMPAMSGKQVINRLAANNPHYGNHSIANIHIIDGYAKAPGDFTFTDSNNVLQPKAYSGSYGTNGAHLDFADTSSATALGNDVSGNNNDFTASGLVAGPAYTANSWSTEFDGTGDYLSIPNNSEFAFGTDDFTIEFWAYFQGSGSYENLFDFRPSGQNGNYPALFRDSVDGDLYYYVNGSRLIDNVSVSNNQWYHIAIAREGTTTKLFLNGTQAASATDSTNYISDDLYIGSYDGGGNYFTGKISNLRMIKGRALYTAAFTPPTTALTATDDTVLLTCQDQTVRDNSNLGHSITVTGDTTFVNQGPFNGYSFNFDGSGDYLTIPHTTDHNPGTGDYTIEGWFKTSATVSYQTIISKYGSPNAMNGWYISLDSAGTGFYASVFDNVSTQVNLTGGSNLNNGAWHHFAVCRSGTDLRLFVDGTVVDSTTNSFDIQSTRDVRISGYPGVSRDWNGQLSNIRIVKGQALYTANFTPPTADLTTTSQGATASNVKLLTCQDSTFADKSGVGEAITVNGNAAVSTSAPFANHHSVEFDGTGDYLDIASNAEYAFGDGDFTIEAWVYPASTTDGVIYSGEVANSLFLYFSTGNFVVRNYAMADLISVTAPSTNAWTHIAVTRSGTDLRLFFNGVQQGNNVLNSTTFTQNGTEIGAFGNGQQSLNGKISNLRVTKGQALYTAAFTPSTTPLTTTSQGAKAGNVKLLTCNSSTIIDTSGKNITATGDASTIAVNPHTDKYSVTFDGTGDYLTVPASSDFDFGTGDFTVEAWIYWDGTYSSNGRVIYATGGSGSLDQFGIFSGNGLFFAGVYNNVAANYPPTNAWSHVAATRSGTTIKLYVNGVETASGTQSGSVGSSSATAYVGLRGADNNHPWKGEISNLRLTKGQALYTADFLPSKEDLTTTSQDATASNVKLLTCQSYKIQDNSDSAHTITVNGDAKPSSDAPFVTSGAGSFDGNDFLATASDADFNFGTGAFSVEMWMYPTATPAQFDGILFGNNPSTTGIFWAYRNGSLDFINQNDSYTLLSTPYPALNRWTHVAVCRDSSGTIRLFKDGFLEASATSNTDDYSQTEFYIGGQSTYEFTGYLSNVRYSKGYARYTEAFTPPTGDFDPADQNTTFLALQGNTLDDLSGNDHAVTANGDAATTTVSPFEPVDGSDAMLDSPTNYGSGDTVRGNYCTLNPVFADTYGSAVNGNLEYLNTGGGDGAIGATMAVSSGKWYYESTTTNNGVGNGDPSYTAGFIDLDIFTEFTADIYYTAGTGFYGYYDRDGRKVVNGTLSSFASSAAVNDVVGYALDLDAGELEIYKNGVSLGVAATGLTGKYMPCVISGFNGQTANLNFGQQPFKYPVAGYKSWCTTNLPTPAVADGSTAMNVALWTGDGASSKAITGLNHSPDLVWIRRRDAGAWHAISDSVRGAGKILASNSANSQYDNTGSNDAFKSFDSDGFTVGFTNSWYTNRTNETHVGWSWDAGSSTVTNTDGTITSQVRANPTAGFSIVKFTDTSGTPTVGHGLNSAPSLLITKSSSGGYSWWTYHASLGTGKYIALNTTTAAASNISWVSAPTSTVFTASSGFFVNGEDHIVYAFAPVEGFSAFGSYSGNNSTNGPFIYTGFRPRYILLRCHNASQNWITIDTARDIDNPDSSYLLANDNNLAEGTLSPGVDILSNGFKLRTNSSGWNGSGEEFIYAAFAEHPFKTSRAR